jgi:Putative zinc-finger
LKRLDADTHYRNEGLEQDGILGMEVMEPMDHAEAREQMLAEKYLLNELPPEIRDAFEEHFFDCPECAFDIRAGAAFVNEAKAQLPALTASSSQGSGVGAGFADKKRNGRFSLSGWLKPLFASPVFAAPVFATLLLVVGYQNLVTYPAMRTALTEPRLLPSVALHTGSRGGTRTAVQADRKQGVALVVDVPEQAAYASYAVDLYNPQGKLAWTRKISIAEIGTDDGTLTVAIPGPGLTEGTYSLAISGIGPADQRTEIARRAFDIHFNN